MSTKLGPEDFVELGVELEDLKITHTGLQTIKAHAFKNVRAIRRLDLSENQISQIESEAFAEVSEVVYCAILFDSHVSTFQDRPLAKIVENLAWTGTINKCFSHAIVSSADFLA